MAKTEGKARPRFVAVSGRSRADDARIMADLAQRRPGSWEAFEAAVWPMVLRIVTRYFTPAEIEDHGDDILQRVRVRMLLISPVYDRRIAALTTFVHRCVGTECRNILRERMATTRGGPGWVEGTDRRWREPRATFGGDHGVRLAEQNARTRSHVDDIAERDQREHDRRRVREAMRALDPRQRRVLRERVERGRTLSQTSDELGLSRERVRGIQREALAVLREELECGRVA